MCKNCQIIGNKLDPGQTASLQFDLCLHCLLRNVFSFFFSNTYSIRGTEDLMNNLHCMSDNYVNT